MTIYKTQFLYTVEMKVVVGVVVPVGDSDSCVRTSGKCSVLCLQECPKTNSWYLPIDQKNASDWYCITRSRGKMIVSNYYKKNPTSVEMGVVDAIKHS